MKQTQKNKYFKKGRGRSHGKVIVMYLSISKSFVF